MTEYLEMLDKMKDLQIVRFFSRFFTESSLSPLFGDLKDRAADGTVGSLAKELIVWAVILALGAFIIDQAFYWTRPGQLEQARETWQGVKDGAANVYDGVRSLISRVKAGKAPRNDKELPRGRR